MGLGFRDLRLRASQVRFGQVEARKKQRPSPSWSTASFQDITVQEFPVEGFIQMIKQDYNRSWHGKVIIAADF